MKKTISFYGAIFISILLMFVSYQLFLEKKSAHIEVSKKAGKERSSKKSLTSQKVTAEQLQKGYNLPIKESEKKEAEEDCKRAMALIWDIYKKADKGDTSNVVLSDENINKMQNKLKGTSCPVASMVTYSNMEHYEKMDLFLKECKNGKSGTIVVYEICSDGGIERMKFNFDGSDLYVLSANALWNKENKPKITCISYTKIKAWKYTEKGWFGYELCVPEPPEVSEIVDGSLLIRVKPITRENREYSKKIVQKIGYQGNNLLCSNWDEEHLEKLNYNGLYEYLYQLKYKESLDEIDNPDGVPKDAFETLITEYLPVTSKRLQKYASFDKKKQTYANEQSGYFNYMPSVLGTSVPEVVDIKENKDGTVTLTVDAVCDMVVCEDALITHELTVQFGKDGSFKYLGNKIVGGDVENIPNY